MEYHSIRCIHPSAFAGQVNVICIGVGIWAREGGRAWVVGQGQGKKGEVSNACASASAVIPHPHLDSLTCVTSRAMQSRSQMRCGGNRTFRMRATGVEAEGRNRETEGPVGQKAERHDMVAKCPLLESFPSRRSAK